ncbi:MAG: YqeG family HAD IIIA-type phosphatase [Clostridiales bacterium]|jgi:HAD superfamily phosphatase (TIGR01668 family)|nr:YqeG family HAD IIIA-type phosphatase [Clostridiales bacterium]
MIFDIFYPKICSDSVFDVDYNRLLSAGIKLIAFDVDNTLAPFNIAYPPDNIVRLIQKLKTMFHVCLISNNKGDRVHKFNEKLGLFVIADAKKPKTDALCHALRRFNVQSQEAALIGDQLFTDMCCANLSGATSVLVKPIVKIEEPWVMLKRPFEKLVFLGYIWKRKKGADSKN